MQYSITDIDGITLDRNRNLNWNFSYRYFTKETFKYKLNEFFFFQESFSDKFARMNFFQVVLLFENEDEHNKFNRYIKENWEKRDEYLKDVYIPHIPNLSEYKEGTFVEEYKNALILNKMLNEFRDNN